MQPFTDAFHHWGSLLASPESETTMATRSTPAGVSLPCQASFAARIGVEGTWPSEEPTLTREIGFVFLREVTKKTYQVSEAWVGTVDCHGVQLFLSSVGKSAEP